MKVGLYKIVGVHNTTRQQNTTHTNKHTTTRTFLLNHTFGRIILSICSTHILKHMNNICKLKIKNGIFEIPKTYFGHKRVPEGSRRDVSHTSGKPSVCD